MLHGAGWKARRITLRILWENLSVCPKQMLLPRVRESASRSTHYRGRAAQTAKTATDLHCMRYRVPVAVHRDEVASKDLHFAVHKGGSAAEYADTWKQQEEKLNPTKE